MHNALIVFIAIEGTTSPPDITTTYTTTTDSTEAVTEVGPELNETGLVAATGLSRGEIVGIVVGSLMTTVTVPVVVIVVLVQNRKRKYNLARSASVEDDNGAGYSCRTAR